MTDRCRDLLCAIEAREHHAGGAQIEHSPRADPLRALDANNDGDLMDPRRQDLPYQFVFAPGPVFKVD